MNAAHDKHPLTGAVRQPADHGSLGMSEPDSDLSALVDGELDVQALDALLQSLAEDEGVRRNRLGLLQRIAALADGVADLSKLEGF